VGWGVRQEEEEGVGGVGCDIATPTYHDAFKASRRLREDDPTGTTAKSMSSTPAPVPAPASPGGGPAGKVASRGPPKAAPPSLLTSPTSTRNFRDLAHGDEGS
jgi:hypothetical protein